MMKARLFKLTTAFVLMLTLLITTAASTFAASSVIKKSEYEGKGKVEVDFSKKVQYKNVKVAVKDSSGKSCTATILEKDDDDLIFKINGYKTGETYKYTIKGVKVKGSSKYKNYSGKVKIPAAAKTTVTKSKAIKLATKHAADNLGAANFRDKEAEKDTYKGTASWDVSFEATINGVLYEFEYEINRSTGKIMHYTYEVE